MIEHECRRRTSCICSSQALEPDDNCPVHSLGEFPPRCEVCGKFMQASGQSDDQPIVIPNSCGHRLNPIEDFTPCCLICSNMIWNQGLCSKVNGMMGFAMVCDYFKRLDSWRSVGNGGSI